MSTGRSDVAVTGFTALAGNMPFLGGRRIATEHGETYAEWLTAQYDGTGGTDYAGYFLLRAGELLGRRGTVGFIATDAISDGDNRRTTLARLLTSSSGFELFRAQDATPWPGNAAVLIAVLHLARGGVGEQARSKVLNGRSVQAINSRLQAGAERSDPIALEENSGHAFVGCFLRGDGFVLSDAEAKEILRTCPAEERVVRRFLVGDDLNNRPDQTPSRYVVSFEDMTESEARRFPAAFGVVETRVRPQRERLKSSGADADHKKHWWRFANTRRELRERLRNADRVIATARVSKHVLFSFTSSDCVPSEQVVVFPFNSYSLFGVLQSRIHGSWVRMLAGARGEGIRYSASECFDAFPFPERQPTAMLPAVELAARAVDSARFRYLAEQSVGLTETYNRLLDPRCSDDDVLELRAAHEALDEAVLDAYAWPDLAVPRYCPRDPEEQNQTDLFFNSIVDRLLELNSSRSAGAAAADTSAGGPKTAKARSRGPGLARVEGKRSKRRKAASSDEG